MGVEAELAAALRPVVAGKGLELWDVQQAGACLTVLVDRPGGVDLDALAALSADISDFLDTHDHLAPAGRYELDVSSPGLERRLRAPEHFESCIGQEVAVKTSVAVDGNRRYQGKLVSVMDGEVVLLLGPSAQGPTEKRVPIGAIERAHTVFRWGPPPRPISPSKRKARAGADQASSATQAPVAQAPEEG